MSNDVMKFLIILMFIFMLFIIYLIGSKAEASTIQNLEQAERIWLPQSQMDWFGIWKDYVFTDPEPLRFEEWMESETVTMFKEQFPCVYPTEAPIPASGWLLLSGLAGLMAVRRKK